ncbi:MAG: MFS transporter [Cyclobacteriaceae bacterium]
MKTSTRLQLSTMMFLQYCAWGAWYGQMSKYMTNQLGATGDQVGQAYAAFSIAMIAAPFFVGILADRFFSAQKVMGWLNLAGAVILFWVLQIDDPNTFFWAILLYCLTFTPTISLAISISMQQMENSEKEFPSIRVLGTIAWIVIVNIVGFMGIGGEVVIFEFTMWFSIVLGVFSFFLPKTPPTSEGPVSIGQILGKDALVLLKEKSYLIFFISSIVICIPLAFYYTWGNPAITDAYIFSFPDADPTGFKVENKMSLGQASEVIFMLILPILYVRLGIKKIIIVGLIAWIIRFVFFGFGNADSLEWMFYVAILLHGICYDFFFVSGQIYTDRKAGPKIKSQAIGLITLATYGVGMFIGSLVSGWVKDAYTYEEVTNWTGVWLFPSYIVAVVLVFVVIFFHEKGKVVTIEK